MKILNVFDFIKIKDLRLSDTPAAAQRAKIPGRGNKYFRVRETL